MKLHCLPAGKIIVKMKRKRERENSKSDMQTHSLGDTSCNLPHTFTICQEQKFTSCYLDRKFHSMLLE